ncbi:MAG: hypothetical protein AMXMBFR84_17310 [Candidatus Hydrogenedentota bacterium]
MVRRSYWILGFMCALASAGAWAADDDGVMGNWEGKFADADWAVQPLRAKIVGEGSNTWRAIFYVGSDAGAHAKVEVPGIRKGEKDIQFSGDVDLGKDFGGKFTLEGSLTGEGVIAGTLKSKAKTIPFTLSRVFLKSPTEGATPPEGAVVLMDGTDQDFERWHPVSRWQRKGPGRIGLAGGSYVSKAEFGSCQIHVEFITPYMPGERGQARGNSGVYVQGRYEVQVLDNFGWDPADNLCGGIYKMAVPIADAVFPPLSVQTYDITFHAPKFDATGKKTQNAKLHVVHNGVVIHDNLELPNGTPGGVSDQEAATGPLLFQDHGDEVAYQNVWVKPIED